MVLQASLFVIAFLFAPKHGYLASQFKAKQGLRLGHIPMDNLAVLFEPFSFTFMQQAFAIVLSSGSTHRLYCPVF